MANSAEAAISGVSDSMGPVNPKITPTLTACPSACAVFIAPRQTARNAAAATNFNGFFI